MDEVAFGRYRLTGLIGGGGMARCIAPMTPGWSARWLSRSCPASSVLKLAARATTPTVLPFTGPAYPWDVAVGTAGTVYVADHANNQVLKLPAQ